LAIFSFVFKSFPVHLPIPSDYWSFGVARRGCGLKGGLNFQDHFCRVDKAQAVIHLLEFGGWRPEKTRLIHPTSSVNPDSDNSAYRLCALGVNAIKLGIPPLKKGRFKNSVKTQVVTLGSIA